ncbi:probable E3 ubiquitin-protein ligase MID2 [Liolophura sinensis]|uniref:probable E3 ubiquitin-protein ligase MID2 n=1 Tax=Liolophura sinensis TaxID=3198878 RepID=UPI003158C929
MAESKQNRDDVLTCSVCMETFREPVMLPCQHSFCRECIGLYADKSKPVQTDKTSGNTGNEDVHQQIACPVCRAPTSLGKEGVAGLPPNFHLAEIVEKLSAVKLEDDIPYCSMCEDNHAKAVKFCTICNVLYCQECLTNYHPTRGPLKRHRLISSLEYLSRETSQGQVSRDLQSTQQPSCARHGQPFGLYCVPCRMVICMGCVVDHPEHAMRDIPSAVANDKEEWGFLSCTVVSRLKGGFVNVPFFPLQLAVLNKTSELEKVLQETKESLSGVTRLHNKIQENQELHTQEVEKAYCAALESLQAWRQHSIDGIKTRYSQWSVECSAILKHIQLQTQEMERMVQASNDLLASVDVEFLKGSTHFTKTIDDQLNEIKADLEEHEVSKQKLLDFVQRDLVVPRHLTVKETVEESQDLEAAVSGQMSRPRVTKPTLRFTETDDRKLRITDSGCVVEGKGLFGWRRAVTDGRYQTGRYYWEIHITCSHGCYYDCRVGVTQESCGVSEETDPGRNFWYIVMAYSGDEVKCYSHSGGEIKPDYRQDRRYTRPHHLGVYLDCDEHTLTVLDCDNNQVMYTNSGVIVTEPLVPWVEFGFWSGSVSARLVTGDSATLPPVLCDMISTS